MLALAQPALWLLLFPPQKGELVARQTQASAWVYLSADAPLPVVRQGSQTSARTAGEAPDLDRPVRALGPALMHPPTGLRNAAGDPPAHDAAPAPLPEALSDALSYAQPRDPPPLVLSLPRSFVRETEASAAALAAQDPRGNSPVLSPSERFAVRLGTVNCYVDERLPDGTTRRRPGRRVAVERLHAQATGNEKPVHICVQ